MTGGPSSYLSWIRDQREWIKCSYSLNGARASARSHSWQLSPGQNITWQKGHERMSTCVRFKCQTACVTGEFWLSGRCLTQRGFKLDSRFRFMPFCSVSFRTRGNENNLKDHPRPVVLHCVRAVSLATSGFVCAGSVTISATPPSL